LLGSYVQTTLFIFFMRTLPKKFPEEWERSIFRIPVPVFNVLMVVCFLASASNVWGMLRNSDMKTILLNCAVMAIGVVFSLVWYNSGKVTPSVSWEGA
ncbi:MAG: hypothetical protein GXX99_00560, partial [Clostridiales bacterium]|nr:hypothetical protein [Clostridiales bacterium]